MLAPVIKLSPLTYEEMLVLIEKLLNIHAELYNYEPTLSENDLIEFIKIEYSRIGADTNITPREVIRDFIELINIVYQNPGLSVKSILGSDEFSYSKAEIGDVKEDAEFAEFEI